MTTTITQTVIVTSTAIMEMMTADAKENLKGTETETAIGEMMTIAALPPASRWIVPRKRSTARGFTGPRKSLPQ